MSHAEIEGGPRLRGLLKGSAVVWTLLVIMGALMPHEHPHFDFERIPSFAALLGVVSAVGLVQVAAWAGSRGLDRPAGDEDA